MILPDNETRFDFLNNQAIADTVVGLLRARPDHPVTIGIHGDWGAGKSSVLEMIEASLASHEKVLCLKFNGWRFQGFEDAKIALIEGIVTGLVEKRPALTKAANVVKDVFRRIDWLKVAKKAGGLALTAVTGIPTLDQIHTIVGTVEGLLADPSKVLTRENAEGALSCVRSLLKPAEQTKNVPEEIGEFRKAFDALLKEAGVDQLVVLIDDLDRCLPDTAIETLEAVRLFVFTPRTAFVVAADEAMIEYAVRKHFPELPDTTGPRDYARNYLEKLIQVPLRIPALGETETRVFVMLLLVGAELGDDSTETRALVDAARERLRRPWEKSDLDAATINKILGGKAKKAQNALALCDQISPILSSGTEGNPRQIKRFLNALILRHHTAEARGFGDAVQLPTLAKLMLAERFFPRLFDQIATVAATDSNGHCDDLVRLEAAGDAKGADAMSDKPKATRKIGDGKVGSTRIGAQDSGESSVLTEWLASNSIVAWAAVKPRLGSVDLRPYLFVAKDRKDYFGATSVLGHLLAIVEKLLGPKLQVQGFESELKLLVPAEASQVFETLRARIMGAGALDSEPPGVAGLVALVKAQPTLEPLLLDFLEHLPTDRIGAWVLKGWSDAVRTDDGKARLDRMVEIWRTESKNPFLKTAAANVQRTGRSTR